MFRQRHSSVPTPKIGILWTVVRARNIACCGRPFLCNVCGQFSLRTSMVTIAMGSRGCSPVPRWAVALNLCALWAPETYNNDRPELLERFGREVDAIVHEATYTSDLAASAQKAGHSTARAVARVAQQMFLKNLVSTHFSARYVDDASATPSIGDIEAEARREFEGRLFIASDLVNYRIDRDGVMSLAGELGP